MKGGYGKSETDPNYWYIVKGTTVATLPEPE